MKIIGLSGSPTPISRSNWLLQQLLAGIESIEGVEVLAPVRIRELSAQHLLHADLSDKALTEALARVAEADLVVISTPIYKAAYSGLLKVFLDLLPQDGLHGKAIVALATGGSQAHFLAVDYALKPVLSALGARDTLDAVYATDAQVPKDPAGAYTSTPEIDDRLARAAQHIRARVTQHQAQHAAHTHLSTIKSGTPARAEALHQAA